MSTNVGKRIAQWSIILTALDYLVLISLLFFSLIIASSLGPSNYGIFITSSVFYIIIANIISNIMLAPSTKLISSLYGKKDFRDLGIAIGAITIFLFIISSIAITIYLTLIPYIAVGLYHRTYLITYMQMLSPIILFVSFINFSKRILIALGSYRKVALNRILDGLFYITSIITVVALLGWTVNSMILGLNIYNILYLSANIILVRTELKKKGIPLKFISEISHIKYLLSLGKYFLISNTLYNTLDRLDLAIIPIFVSNTYIGYYSFAKNLIMRSRLLFQRLSSLLYPTFSEKLEEFGLGFVKKLLSKGLNFSIYYTFSLAFIILAFSKEIIEIVNLFIFNISQYISAAPLLSIFSVVLIMEGLRAVITSYFIGLPKMDVVVKGSALAFLTGLISIPSFLILLGITGAAIGYVLGGLVGLIYYFYRTSMEIRLDIGKIIRRMATAIASIILVYLLYLTLIDFGLFPPMINNAVDAIIFLLFPFLYLVLDFIILSITNTLTIADIMTLKKIAGDNRVSRKVMHLIEKAYKKLNREGDLEKFRE